MSQLHSLRHAESDETSYDHVLKYTGVFGGVEGLKKLVGVGRTKLTTLLIGSAGIGLISAYSSIFEFLVSASNMGIPLNATRQTSALYETGTEEEIVHRVMVIRTWVLWSALLSVIVCLLFSPLISYFFFDHDWHRWPEVMLTSLVAVSNIIAEGECAILKGFHQVRKMAIVETTLAFTTLLCTIPLYYLLGMQGVILGLIASGMMSAIVHFAFTLRMVSYRISPFSRKVFVEGLPLIKVGIPFVLAGVAGSSMLMAVSAIILLDHTKEDLGYYSAGYVVMVGYAGMVLAALEADFFPRLSSVADSVSRMNSTVNQQIEVSTLVSTPLLILLLLLLPVLLPLLYKPDFLVVADMATLAVFYTFLRCLSLPMGYTILAKGHSLVFLVLEVLFNLFFILLFWWCYDNYGLAGGGAALSLGALYDVVIYGIYCHYRYHFALSGRTLRIFLAQMLCLTATVAVCFVMPADTVTRYMAGGAIGLTSLCLSMFCLRHSSHAVARLTGKLFRS